ncbi:MAG TPA: hypothetical protein DCQ93_02895 [Bacteroidetes bacterium]|nr:hypothetical protein [Bacteroidota bacterium]
MNAIPREAYKLLLVVNYRGWASRISRSTGSLRTNIENTWYNLGGDIDNFWKNVNKGNNKKPLLCGSKCKDKIPADTKTISADGMEVAINTNPYIPGWGYSNVEKYYDPLAINDPTIFNPNWWAADAQNSGSTITLNPTDQIFVRGVTAFGEEFTNPWTIEAVPTTSSSMLLLGKKRRPLPVNPDDQSFFGCGGEQFYNCVEPASATGCTVAAVVTSAASIIAALAGFIAQIVPKKEELLPEEGGYPQPQGGGQVVIQTEGDGNSADSGTGNKTATVVAVIAGGLILTGILFMFIKK